MTLPKRFKDEWKHLLKDGQPFSFKKGQVLFYEGHHPYGLFVLQSGDVKFSKEEEEGFPLEEGDRCQGCMEEHSPVLSKGRVLGLTPFFEGAPYCCTCTAKEDCRGIFISKTQLTRIMPSPDLNHS